MWGFVNSFLLFQLIQVSSATDVVVDVDGSLMSDGDHFDDEVDVIPYMMEHSLSLDGEFVPRGTIDVILGRRKNISFRNELMLSGVERDQFEELRLKEGFYRIRIKALSQANTQGNWIMASIPVCDLVKSGFKEEMKLLFDTSSSAFSSIASMNGGGESSSSVKLLSLDYRVQTSRFTKAKDCHGNLPTNIHFSSAATFTTATPAQALAVQPMDGAAANGAPPPGVPPQLVRKNDMNSKGPGGTAGGGDAQQGSPPEDGKGGAAKPPAPSS